MTTGQAEGILEEIADEAKGAAKGALDVRQFLVSINGRGEYLEVKWRLYWLRYEHPDAELETAMVAHEPGKSAVFKARVAIPGGGSATGWGSETVGDFRDYLEKAETKAIGRALAALGFGTQFCHDHDFGHDASEGRVKIVDAPIDAPRRGRGDDRGTRPSGGGFPSGNGGASSAAQATQRATERQVKFIYAIGREAGLEGAELEDWSRELYGVPIDELNRRDASALIESLQRRRNEIA